MKYGSEKGQRKRRARSGEIRYERGCFQDESFLLPIFQPMLGFLQGKDGNILSFTYQLIEKNHSFYVY